MSRVPRVRARAVGARDPSAQTSHVAVLRTVIGDEWSLGRPRNGSFPIHSATQTSRPTPPHGRVRTTRHGAAVPRVRAGRRAVAGDGRRARAISKRLAPSDVTLTLIGETGTGKDVLAHAIHDASPRARRPVRRVRLRRGAAQPDGERAVRSREGRVHGRPRRAHGRLRARRGRHAVPRRDRRAAARSAAAAPARARQPIGPPRRRHARSARRRAHRRRHQPRPRGVRRARSSFARTSTSGWRPR